MTYVSIILVVLVAACGPNTGGSHLQSDNSTNFSGLLEVSSTYTDDQTKEKIEIEGRGFVIEYLNHKFIVTAAHLSQGDLFEGGKVKVTTLDGQKVKTISSYGEAKMDVEFFDFDDRKLNLEPTFECNSPKEEVIGTSVIVECVFEITEAFKNWLKLGNNSHKVGIDLLVPSIAGKSIPDFSHSRETGSNEFMELIFRNHGTIHTSSDTVIPKQIPYGYSGSPVISLDSSGTFSLQGMVQAQDRIYDRSWIKSWSRSFLFFNYFAQAVINNQIREARNIADPYTWRMQYKHLYRIGKPQNLDYSIGEFAFARPPTGGTRGETGGTRGETGGTRGETGDDASVSEMQKYLESLRPGMQVKFQGEKWKDCYAFTSKRDGYSHLMAPTTETVSVVQQNMLFIDRSITLEPLCDWDSLKDQVYLRFKRIADHHVGDGQMTFNLYAHSFKEAARRKPSSIRVERDENRVLIDWKFDQEKISIEILSDGSLNIDGRSQTFSPVITLKTGQGKTLKLNLYEFIFESPSAKMILNSREYIFFSALHDGEQLLFVDQQIERQSIRGGRRE